MLPGSYSPTVIRGASWNPKVAWSPGGAIADLTGYTATGAVYTAAGGTSEVAITVGLTNGTTTLPDGTPYNITLALSPTQTTGLTAGAHWWHLFLTDGAGVVYPVLAGTFNVVNA